MKKRKGGDVDEEVSIKKTKVSGFATEKENNNKPRELARTGKSLLQKEQTRLSGLTKLLHALKESQSQESFESIIKEVGEFQEVFGILESGRHSLSQLEIQKCLEILESVLLFTAEDKQFSTRTGMVIVQRVLQSHMKILYSCLNPGNPPEVINAALRLLTAMVTQGASAAREVQRSFDFTLKFIGSLPNKRDTKSAQDVRTCFIYFCLSFLMFGDLAVMKHILELKGFLQSVMKGLQSDSPNVVHTVLSTLQVRVVENTGITKKTKVQFFNSYVLSQMAALYQYTKDAEEESSQTVREQVHELLMKICGSFKIGICFSNSNGAFATRSNNPVLLRFLQNLSSVASDVFAQELVIKVICCCQDVLSPFLSGLVATYEPRLSMPWVSNMNLVTKMYIALPQPSQVLEKSGLTVTVEMLPSLINMVIPVGISRTVLNHGVQHASSLVKHTTLSLLVVILERAQNAAGYLAFKSSATLNREDIAPHSESVLLQQFREEVLKRLPDVKTVISLRQNLIVGSTKEETQEDFTSPTILLAQSLKVILGFQTLLPSILSHVNFDLKKLLPGQQEIHFPPIVQQLTLQILLQAPASSLKWYQQKGKIATSFVYSVLSLYTSASSKNIKNEAKQLWSKLLSEIGLISDHSSEVDVWLTQLHPSEATEGQKETLLRFLDEVVTTVAVEPYVYSDIMIDRQAEAVAAEASGARSGTESSEWDASSDASLPVSLLFVGALKLYSEMVLKMNNPDGKAAVSSIGCIARYMNRVVFEVIHSSKNPTILCYVVSHYYGNTVVPEHLKALRSMHEALLQYVSYWLPGSMQDKTAHSKEKQESTDNSLNKLHRFLDKTAANSEEEIAAVSEEFYLLLEPLDEVQLSAAIVDCVEFCKHELSADFSPLVRVLQVKNYQITGSVTAENIAPLLQALPFSMLLWQVIGVCIEDSHKNQLNRSSLESNSSSLVYNSWIQSLLVTAIEKEPASKSVSLCRHLLLYLRFLKTKLTTDFKPADVERDQAAILLCFQLLQYLLQRHVRCDMIRQNGRKDKASIMDPSHSTCEPDKKVLCHVQEICRSVLHHPVILSCFLWEPTKPGSHHFPANFGIQLTYNVSNLLLAVLPNLTLEQKDMLMRPFVRQLCNVGRLEIQAAQGGNVVSSSQALYLLGLFHDYCDEEDRVKFISSLSELPSNLLVRIDSRSEETVPSVFLLTLLMLLEDESPGEDKVSHSSPVLHRKLELNTEEPLTVEHFKQLIEISENFKCPQLDSTILKLLQKSLAYVLASTNTLLDSCLDHPTLAKIQVAAHLVVHAPALRSHFELRCLSSANTETSPIEFKDHLNEFLPLVSSYLYCVRGMWGDTSGKTRTQAVILHLSEEYWVPLWEWLVGDREGVFKTSEESCMGVLVVLIHGMERDDNLKKKFNELLRNASLWDICQLKICYHLLMSLCSHSCTDGEKAGFASKFCFACMEFLSSSLNGEADKKGDDGVFKDSLAYLESFCKNSDTLTASDDFCVSTWNSFVTDSLRYRFGSANVLRTLKCIIKALYKEQADDKSISDTLLSLDTLYEMVLSHSQFLEIILSDKQDQKRETKEALIELMVSIVEMSPTCCKASHLPVLFAAYSASLSITDQSILYLLNLYEKNHTSFKNYRPFLWGSAAANHHQTAKSLGPSLWQQPSITEVLEQLDASKMDQSAVSFPQSRILQPHVQLELCHEYLQEVYDPCFLLPLFSCLLAPNYQVDCRKFVEQGCLSFTVASLSSRDAHVRQAGYHVLTRFMMHLEGARFKERKQVTSYKAGVGCGEEVFVFIHKQIFHLLKSLKNGITEANCRLSSVMVCFIARVAYILLKPEHPFFITMNSYLLQRPALDLRDLPLFYVMFNSSTMQHVAERSWMLQLLLDGMKDSPDYYLYKRRHVIELALSYHDSPVSDQHSQDLVTHLLQSALKIHPAAYDLAKNYGIVAWIHSLCYKSPERLCTSLNLVHTVWFTLHRGSTEKRAETSSDRDDKNVHEEVKAVRLPPNVAQECALVCWTLLEQLRLRPGVRDTFTFLQVLSSIISYLTTNGQLSGLSRDRILSLLHLWCATFDETGAMNQLLSSVSLKEKCSSRDQPDSPPCTDCDYNKLKTESLSFLLSVLTTWKPSLGSETDEVILLVWRFGLSFSDKSAADRKFGNFCILNNESQTPVRLLSLVRWFRKCLVWNRPLQDRLVTASPASEVRLILQLYQASSSSDNVGLREHKGLIYRNARFAVLKELNMICLVLFAAVQRFKQESDKLTSRHTVVCHLILQQPYAEFISDGLQKVILPLLPDPGRDLEESSQDQDVVLQELVSLFMQELWMERPVPQQLFSFVLNHSDVGCAVVDSLILALGGTKLITKWLQKNSSTVSPNRAGMLEKKEK